MASASEGSAEISDDVEEVQIVENEDENKGKIEPVSQSEKDPPKNSCRVIRTPKNLILVEGDPLDSRVEKKRQMRSFPADELLSAKIKMANGTDYSNHFIEQHFNSGLCGESHECKKKSENIWPNDFSKRKKVCSDDLRFDFEKQEKKSFNLVKGSQEIIDLTVENCADDEVEIIECKNKSADKLDSKFNNIAALHRLVPYSSSEEESEANEDKFEFKSADNYKRKHFLHKRR